MQKVALRRKEVQPAGLVCQHKVEGPSCKLGLICHDMAACHTAVCSYCTQKSEVLGPELWLASYQALCVGSGRDEALGCAERGGCHDRCCEQAASCLCNMCRCLCCEKTCKLLMHWEL